MTLDAELTAAGNVVQAGRDNAAQHLQRVARITSLNTKIINDYREYLDTTTSVAQTTLDFCWSLVSAQARSGASPSEETTQTVRGLIMGVVESMKAMYFVMNVVEKLTPQVEEQDSGVQMGEDDSRPGRRCSFCGKDGKVVAGPAVNICASCTRLACAVLGIPLQE